MALAQSCMDAWLGLCVVVSDSGEAANLVAKYRPPVPLVVVSAQPPVVSQREVFFGQVGARETGCMCAGPAGGTETDAVPLLLDAAAIDVPACTRGAVSTCSTWCGDPATPCSACPFMPRRIWQKVY